jgi:hypothetical protein
MFEREAQVISLGSRLFPYSVPLVAHTQTYWYNIKDVINQQEAALWDYLDSLVILNNSGLPVNFYLNNSDNDYYILAYGTQPISRRAFRTFGFFNPDAANDIAAGLISMNMRRLPPDVISTVQVS